MVDVCAPTEFGQLRSCGIEGEQSRQFDRVDEKRVAATRVRRTLAPQKQIVGSVITESKPVVVGGHPLAGDTERALAPAFVHRLGVDDSGFGILTFGARLELAADANALLTEQLRRESNGIFLGVQATEDRGPVESDSRPDGLDRLHAPRNNTCQRQIGREHSSLHTSSWPNGSTRA